MLEQPKKANFSHRGRGPEHSAQLQQNHQREAFTNSPTPVKHATNRGPGRAEQFDMLDRRNSPEAEERRAVPRPQSAKLKKRKAQESERHTPVPFLQQQPLANRETRGYMGGQGSHCESKSSKERNTLKSVNERMTSQSLID